MIGIKLCESIIDVHAYTCICVHIKIGIVNQEVFKVTHSWY